MSNLVRWLTKKLQETFASSRPLPWKIIDAHEKIREGEDVDQSKVLDKDSVNAPRKDELKKQ